VEIDHRRFGGKTCNVQLYYFLRTIPTMSRSIHWVKIVEQACNIFYILHRILYFLPEVRGEGSCGGRREERSINHIA